MKRLPIRFALSVRPLLGGVLLPLFALLAGCSGGGGGGGAPTVTSGDVGPGGGQVSSGDGVVTLVIPAGALASTQTIVITTLSDAELSAGLQGFGPDQAYRFEPDGLQFAVPATLSFDLGAPTSSSAGSFNLIPPAVVTESNGMIDDVDSGTLDVFLTSQTYSAPITHFSDYAVKTESSLVADFTVTYPTSLPVGGKGTIGLVFVPSSSTDFDSWDFGNLSNLDFDDTNYCSGELSTTLDVICLAAGPASVDIDAEYSTFLFGDLSAPHDALIEVHVDIDCTGDSSGIFTSDILLDLSLLGYTQPEAATVADWCDQESISLWVATAEAAIRINPLTGAVLDSIAQAANLFDAVPIKAPGPGTGPELGMVANGNGVGGAYSYDEASCTLFPGLFLVDSHQDITQVAQDPSLGAVGASVFARVSLYSLDPILGGYDLGGFNTTDQMETVVSNATKDHLLGVTKFARQLVLLDPSTDPATQTFVANLGNNPRRMRWDPTSGLGAISDFMDNTLTVFLWDGSATPPTIIATVPVGAGPVGIDVFGNLIVCAGFNDDTFTLIIVNLALASITSTATQPIPFASPTSGPLQPGHAFFIRDANNTVGFSFFGANAMGFTPFAF